MRYGAMNFPVKPILAEIESIGALGLDYLELAMDPPQAHHRQIAAQRGAIEKALIRHGLGLVCHLPTFVFTADLTESLRRASLDEVLRSLAVGAELGATKAVLHPGYITGLAPFVMEQAVALAIESIATAVEAAKELGITLCIENLFPKHRPFAEPEQFARLLDRFPGLNFVLDTGHAHMDDPGGGRITAFIDQCGGRLAHLHVSDNNGRQDEHLPLGEGSIDFVAVAKALKRSGYDDTTTLEIFTPDRQDLVASRDRLERLLAESHRD